MKQLLLVAALAMSFPALAQTSTSGSNATASPNISNSSGNSGADSSSSSTSNPNNANQQFIQLNTVTPDTQTLKSTSSSTTDSTQRVIQSGATVQDVRYSGTQTIKNVPGIAMSGPASGPCTGASGGVGVSGPGFGVGLNGAKVDDGCTVRENTRVLGQLFQALDSADPLKAQAKASLLKSMAILDAMNDKIGAGYLPPPAPAPKVAEAPVAVPSGTVFAARGEPTDPYIRARMGLK